MIPKLAEKIFGPNWRTSLMGLLETITVLGTVWVYLPPEHKSDPRLWGPAILAALWKTLKESQIKDKKVSGNPAEGFVVGAKPDEAPREVK